MRNKKGELTTTQLVTIIVLIASFAVILFFIFRLNLGETTDKEICHNSVVLRGQSGLSTGPLDCRTSYVCISGGGECEQITATTTIEAGTKEEVMKALAQEMSNCWWMFGEGNIKYGEGFASTSVHCAICSIIDFDENVQEISDITYGEFYNFLSQTKKESTKTYLEYLYDTNNIGNIEDKEYFKVDLSSGFIDLKERQSIITGVDMNIKILFVGNDDRYLNTFIIPTNETSGTECKAFITKA